MSLTTAGAQIIPKALFNLNSPTLFSSGANACIGVGSGGGTAFLVSQTDLQAATEKYRSVATCTESAGVVTAIATYGTSVANFVWSEWGIFNTGATQTGGTMLGRKVESPDLGTKTSAQVWTMTATATFAAA